MLLDLHISFYEIFCTAHNSFMGYSKEQLPGPASNQAHIHQCGDFILLCYLLINHLHLVYVFLYKFP